MSTITTSLNGEELMVWKGFKINENERLFPRKVFSPLPKKGFTRVLVNKTGKTKKKKKQS